MKALFSELDGTTWIIDIFHPIREFRAPIIRSISPVMEDLPLDEPTCKMKKYALVGVSDQLAFYDRVLDAEEIR